MHYNGIVFGGEDEAQWTNVDGVTHRRFLNPLIQNEGRSRAINIGPDGVFLAIVVSESLLTLLSIVVFRRGRWKQQIA